MVLERLCLSKANAAHLSPMIETLDHRYCRHDPQKQHQPPRPEADRSIGLVFAHRLETAQVVGGGRGSVHDSANSEGPSGAKWRSTSASPTSASVAGRQRGLLSLSTITARTPS